MKTTLELPDDLFREAKATAARRRTTLKSLVTRALERELHGEKHRNQSARIEIDEDGWPVLKRPTPQPSTVTEEFIDKLRESEGV